jgi:general secretion pathway protein H
MRASGFTLLELMVALGLAAVLGGISVVRLVALVEGARLAGGVRTVATTLRVARGRAMAGGASIEVRFDPTRRTCDTRDADGRTLESAPLPRGIAFAALPARARILFGGLGLAENGTITLGSGARQRSVIVNQRGRVRLS